MEDKIKFGRKSSVVPIEDNDCRIEDYEFMGMEDRKNWSPLHHRVKEAAVTAWSGENVAIAVSDILGPHARKEWNLPVGSHKNPFWRLTKKVSTPSEVKKLLTKSLTVASSMGSAALVKNLLEAGADPNGKTGKWGPLHSAAYTGNVEVMRVLLEDSRTNPNALDDKGKTPLHLAAKNGNYEVLKLLLETTESNVNITDETGATALHFAGSSSLFGEVSARRFLQCINFLMNRSDIKLNIPDKDGLTALGKTVTFSRKDITEGMLKHNKGQYHNVDYFMAGYYGSTIRNVITDSYPELSSNLPKLLQENTNSPIVANRILAYLQNGDFNSFQSHLQNKNFDLNHWYDEPYHCTIIEIACQIKDREKFIISLLNAGANPNTVNPITSQSLLHLTAKRGNSEALKILLQMEDIDVNIKDLYNRTPLHSLSSIVCQNKKDLPNLQNSVNLLLGDSSTDVDNRKSDLNAVTCNGETPLHLAARIGEKETILTLLRHGADIMHTTIGMKLPITYIDPSVMECYLDECIENNEHSPMQDDYMLTFDYSFLKPKRENSTNNSKKNTNKKLEEEMPTLKYFSKQDRFRHLLKHPVISSFLQLKWNKVRLIYFQHFLIYSLFLAVLTWHSFLTDVENENKLGYDISLCILSILLLLMFLSHLYQFIQHPKLYVTHSPNWLFWVTVLLSLNVCVDSLVRLIPHCTALALLLAWTYFVSLIGGFPALSIQLEMLNTVSWTFFTFIICYLPLFFAYGICFYTMFRNSGSEEDEFFSVSFGMSMLKTFIMFAGEFEASDIPFEAANVVSHIIFTVFLFLMSIVLLNLLNGLAVSDAQAIRKDAEILSLSARIKHIYYIEKMVPSEIKYFSILDKLHDCKLRIFPNRKTGKIEVNGMTFKNKSIEEDTVQQATEIAQMRKSTISETTDVGLNENDIQTKLSDIEKHQDDVNKKINEITKQLNFLRQVSSDSSTKLNELLTIIKSSGLNNSSIR
ncbi:hypothetical protein L9F63_020999 [Diploptera punctata]|uniref:Ion transport domain-containing protein n=1 Tax=Diploptera punctata TaxID=6984 RepID=A0AAD7ZPT1_DIPPU|nr:hypothetical protein L9F63_020999 [Diploptera punctata]